MLPESPLSEDVVDKEKASTKTIPSVHELLKTAKTAKTPAAKGKKHHSNAHKFKNMDKSFFFGIIIEKKNFRCLKKTY